MHCTWLTFALKRLRKYKLFNTIHLNIYTFNVRMKDTLDVVISLSKKSDIW